MVGLGFLLEQSSLFYSFLSQRGKGSGQILLLIGREVIKTIFSLKRIDRRVWENKMSDAKPSENDIDLSKNFVHVEYKQSSEYFYEYS